MMPKVYVLQHTRVAAGGDEDVKLLGVYSSFAKATEAVSRFQKRAGFAEAPEGFSIDEYVTDRDYWEEGFGGDSDM